MKIIETGTAWWVGKKLLCGDCKTVVELEAEDPANSAFWAGAADNGTEVEVICPTCRRRLCLAVDDVNEEMSLCSMHLREAVRGNRQAELKDFKDEMQQQILNAKLVEFWPDDAEVPIVLKGE